MSDEEPEAIDWTEDLWFRKFYLDLVTPEFEEWWHEFYGHPDGYEDRAEYFCRAGFALQGWKSGREIQRGKEHE